MGKISQIAVFGVVLLLTACLRPTDCSVKPLVEEAMVFNTPLEADSLELGETIWFYGGKPQPDLKNRKTIEKSLPYAPSLRMDFYQVGFGIVTDSLIQQVPGYAYTFTTIRPFVLKSGNSRSAYNGHTQAVFEGQLTKDSVVVSWGLEAKKPGLYWIKLKPSSDVLLDHRTEECPVSWRYNFMFQAAQDFSAISTVWPQLERLDKKMNYLIYVRE